MTNKIKIIICITLLSQSKKVSFAHEIIRAGLGGGEKGLRTQT